MVPNLPLPQLIFHAYQTQTECSKKLKELKGCGGENLWKFPELPLLAEYLDDSGMTECNKCQGGVMGSVWYCCDSVRPHSTIRKGPRGKE